MFKIQYFGVGGSSDLRVFLCCDPLDTYTVVVDLAEVIGIKSDSIRAELSRHNLGSLAPFPLLKGWLIEHEYFPTSTGKLQFASGEVWLRLLQRHISEENWENLNAEVKDSLVAHQREYLAKQQQEREVEDVSYVAPTQVEADEELVLAPASYEVASENSYIQVEMVSSNDSSDSSSDSSSVDSSDLSGADVSQQPLPQNVPDWVTEVTIPEQFSSKDFTKSYSLKSYDLTPNLKKELKKLKKWWMRDRNKERGSKPVGTTTVEKREERILCFLGFVNKYECVSEGREITLALVLNHTLFKAYLEYLHTVRNCADGTIAESITAGITVCKWLYRKENTREWSIIRRYKDWRNEYQARAIRSRKQDDKQELKEQSKWLDWTEFTDLVQKLRREWREAPVTNVDLKSARKLHDLLLLGIYSCIPGRGNECRLLQYFPEETILELKGEKTLKRFVDSKRINLITTVQDEWVMLVSDYKNYKSRGVDTTDMGEFTWWTDLLGNYVNNGYRDILVGPNKEHRYVFVTRGGGMFTPSYFSDFISNLLFKHTKVRIATNLLRSSFVTHFYNSEASKDPVMQESVASVMRHSVNQAKSTYDRRNATDRKRQGLELLSGLASEPKKAHVDEANAQRRVVEFNRCPHEVIREKSDKYLLAKMVRSPSSNAPVYYTPSNARYEWVSRSDTFNVHGVWESNEFVLQ